MGTILLCGLALGLALQVANHLRIAAIPVRAVERLKREIEARARADVAASEQATAKRVGDELVVGLAAAVGELRACAAELRKIQSDGVELLIEQRAYAGELQVLARSAAQQRVSAAPRAPSPEDDQRATVEMPRPAAAPPALDVDEDEDEEEMTQVASRPIAGTPAAPNGLRLASRTVIPPPPPASRRGGER